LARAAGRLARALGGHLYLHDASTASAYPQSGPMLGSSEGGGSSVLVPPLVLELAEALELLLGLLGASQFLVGLAELVAGTRVLGGQPGRFLELLERRRRLSLGQQQLAQHVAGIGPLRLALQHPPQQRD